MSISDCSNEVSFKSACVAKVLLTVPEIVGCAVESKFCQSPVWNADAAATDGRPLFKTAAPLTSLALDIDLASAFVYLEESLS